MKLDSGGEWGTATFVIFVWACAENSLCQTTPVSHDYYSSFFTQKKPSDTEASLREKLNKIQEKLEFMVLIAGYQLVANRTTRHYWAMVLPLVISLCIHSGEYMLKRTKKNTNLSILTEEKVICINAWTKTIRIPRYKSAEQ